MKTLLFLMVSVSINAFAFLPKPNFEALAKSLPRKTFTRAECTNFSGSWKGTCTQNGETKPTNLVVVQNGCGDLKLTSSNGSVENYSIGGQASKNESSPLFQFNEASALSWNADKSVLQLDMVFLFTSPLSTADSVKINGQIMINDGKLFSFMKSANNDPSLSAECQYTLNP